MPKRKRPSAVSSPRTVLLLGLAAVLLFGIGQLVLFLRADRGALFLAKTFGIGGESRVVEVFGRQIREGLLAINVNPDSVGEARSSERTPEQRWRIGLGPGASLIQANHAIARRVEAAGGTVLSGHERTEADGTRRLTLILGLDRRPTHELVITTPRVTEANAEREPARMAIVLYGFGEDAENAAPLFDMPVPFAAAIVPGARWSSAMFRTAHEKKREVVLLLPLEPINYPSVNPGPGAILVTMNGKRVASVMGRHFDQAGAVTAAGNYMGSLATQDMTVMTAVFDELKRRHLPFLHVKGVPGAVCRDLAADLGVVYDEPNAIFDPARWKDEPRRLDREWKAILDQARARGRFTVWIPASKTVLEWLPGAATTQELQAVKLVPLSAVMPQAAR
jgi:polysaccharide deacetylase 2 family uncharacterized protein YibQ